MMNLRRAGFPSGQASAREKPARRSSKIPVWRTTLPLWLVLAIGLGLGVAPARPAAVTERPRFVSPPENISPPALRGAAETGRTLRALRGYWAGGPETIFSYTWFRCWRGALCLKVPEASEDHYTLVPGDVGSEIKVRVAAENVEGLRAATSLATAPVVEASPPEYKGAEVGATTDSSLLTIARPEGSVAGDVLVASVALDAPASIAIVAPQGWSLVRRDSDEGASAPLSEATYWKLVGAAEPESYTWTWTSPHGVRGVGGILLYRGADTGAPVDEASGRFSADVRSFAAPSITTSMPNELYLGLFASTGANGLTTPIGMAEVFEDAGRGAGTGPELGGAAGVASDPGPVGDRWVKDSLGIVNRSSIGQLVAVQSASPLASGLRPRLADSTGQTFYVAPGGSDANPGTFGSPWQTIQHALDTLLPGETALVREGTYAQSLVMSRAGNALAPITVAAYPGERPVVHPGGSGSMDYPVRITAGAAYFRFSGFIVEGGPLNTTMNIWVSDGQHSPPEPAPTHDIEISGCEVRAGVGTGILVSPNTRAVELVGNVVHDNGDGSQQHQGIYFQGQDGLVANNVVYHQTNGFGIQVRGNYPDPNSQVETPAHNVVVTNNTVVDNSLSGIMVENNAAETLVVNNIVAFNGSYGIRGFYNGSGGVLPGNVAHHNLAWGNLAGSFGNSGQAVIDFSGGNLVADPRFVDAEGRNYDLLSDSPALGRGEAAFAPPDNFERSPRGRIPDLGAY
jgi:hypothetical protein